MKALLFTNLFPSVREPTRGVFNLHRFRALSDLCDVRVVCPVPAWKRLTHPREWMRVPYDQWSGIEATYPTYWAVPRVAPQSNADAMYWSVRSHVRKLRKSFAFDVILGAFAYPDVVVAARLAQDAACPLVALVMGSDMNELAQRPGLRNQIQNALKQSSRVIAVSAALKSKVVELGVAESRITVQQNGVDGDRFHIRDRHAIRRHLGIDLDAQLICFVGNLVPEKGPDVLLEAIGRVDQSQFPRLDVVFIGDGPLKGALASRASRLGLGSIVRFLGRRSQDEIPLWLGACDCLCLASRREGCPNVVLEALASGRPVVATEVGGVPELLNTRNGVLVPPNNPDALAAALQATLQRRWQANELRTSIADLTWQTVGRTIHESLRVAMDTCRPKSLEPITVRSLG